MPRRYLLFVLSGEAAEQVQSLRRRWDPVMAERIEPHLTLAYPQEFTDEDLLLERITGAAKRIAPFEVSPGALERSNLGGVWLRVSDPTESWSRLRGLVLGHPFTPYPVTPHITVVHPRTSSAGPEALATIAGRTIDQRCRLDEILYTETGKKGTTVLRTFRLEGPTV